MFAIVKIIFSVKFIYYNIFITPYYDLCSRILVIFAMYIYIMWVCVLSGTDRTDKLYKSVKRWGKNITIFSHIEVKSYYNIHYTVIQCGIVGFVLYPSPAIKYFETQVHINIYLNIIITLCLIKCNKSNFKTFKLIDSCKICYGRLQWLRNVKCSCYIFRAQVTNTANTLYITTCDTVTQTWGVNAL